MTSLTAMLAIGFAGHPPRLHLARARTLGQPMGTRVNAIMADDEQVSRAKGFGADAEARAAKKLDALRTPEQRKRLEQKAERLELEEMVREEGLDQIPEAVSDRMMNRMLTFLGVPLFLGVASFVGFIVAARVFDTTVRPTTVATTTQAIFALALIGITYGPLSASWDEDREGSFFGFEEVKKNIDSLFESMKSDVTK